MNIPAVKHDDLACGIYPEASCPRCKAAMSPAPAEEEYSVRRWHELRLAYWGLLRSTDRTARPMTARDLGRLVATLLSPAHRGLLRELLMDLLAEDFARVALAVHKEATRHAG